MPLSARHRPGTSKWNKIEHRLFCHITRTWRGRPLTSYEIVVNTIAATATSTGLTVTAVLDAGPLPGRGRDHRRADEGPRGPGHRPARFSRRLELRHPPGPPPGPGPRARRTSRPAPDLAALDQPALTGLPPGGAAALAAALAIPHAAHRAARLHANLRSRPRQRADKPRNDPRHKMTFPGYVLAAILHHRFALPARAIAALFGCDRSTIGHELPRIAQLLAATATTIPPGPLTLATYQDLRDYAAGNGIVLPPAPQDHTPPAGHASHPGHAANSP